MKNVAASSMKAVVCFGEALIDFISRSRLQSDGLSIPEFAQYPGGAPANAAVAVAKLGGNARFAGQVGQDAFGVFLQQALQHYGVCTQHLALHATAKTALAFVSHDSKGERSFSFYRDQSADVLYSSELIKPELFSGASLLHFCSNTLTEPGIAAVTAELLQQARNHGLWLSFDVNLRHNLWAAGQADKTVVRNFVSKAQLLKFSHDELAYLSDDTEHYIRQLLAGEAQLVVVTHDDKPVRYFSRDAQGELPVPQVTAVDTTAGGDAFIGGLLYQLSQQDDLVAFCKNRDAISTALAFAARCGAHAVTRPGAFPALPLLADVAGEFSAKGVQP